MKDDSVAIDGIAGWVAQLRAATEERKAAEERIAQARRKIEDALGDAEAGTVGGEVVVRWTPVTSRRLDQTLVKVHVPADVLQRCYLESTTRRFTVVEPEPTP